MKRLIISFSGKCALQCSYCYAPFTGVSPSERILIDILKFAQQEKIDVLTFGGGDPFQYAILRKVLFMARDLGFFVHVDTHGIGLKPSDYSIVQDAVDLVGLPLDGPQFCHDQMRGRTGHFDSVMRILRRLLIQGTRVKINTLVSRLNIDSLSPLGDIIQSNRPEAWSIYQFLPLLHNDAVNELHSVSGAQFDIIASELKKRHPDVSIEIGTPERRKGGYLFVRTDGVLFTHNSEGPGYQTLGDIYSDDWRLRYFENNQTMLPELSQTRYELGRRGDVKEMVEHATS